MKISAIIPAAGKGARAGFGENKLLQKIGGETVIEKTVRAFEKSGMIDEIVLVVSEKDGDLNGSGISHLPVVIGNALQIKLSEFCTFPIQHMVDSPACRLDFCRLRHGFCHVP